MCFQLLLFMHAYFFIVSILAAHFLSHLFFQTISFCNVLSDSVFMRHFVILIILWALEGIVWPPSASRANTYNLSSLYTEQTNIKDSGLFKSLVSFKFLKMFLDLTEMFPILSHPTVFLL